MSVPTGSGVEAQAQSSGAAPTPGPCPGGDVPREGSRDIKQKGKIIAVAYDWCYSTDSPVPYRPWAWQSSASNLANSVRQTDCRSHVLGSIVNQCYGDEPGTGGGVKSGTNLAECTPLSASPTVRAENKPMVRYLDKWHMNHRNTWGCLNNSEDMGKYDAPKARSIDAKLSPISSREEDLQAMADGTKVAMGAPATAPPVAPEPPPPAPPPPTSSGGNVIPFPGTTTDGPIYEAPSNPIRAANPSGSAAPSGPNFFRDYQPVQNDNGGYSYFTNLPAPLDQVYTFGQTGIEMAPGTQYYHVNSNNGHPWLTQKQLNKLYAQLKQSQLRVTQQNRSGCQRQVTVSHSQSPEAANHIDDAQAAGYPSTLTLDRAGADTRRAANLAAAGVPVVSGNDRDEYPPATFSESIGASVRSIPLSDNRSAGRQIGYQMNRPTKADEGCQVTIRTGP